MVAETFCRRISPRRWQMYLLVIVLLVVTTTAAAAWLLRAELAVMVVTRAVESATVTDRIAARRRLRI